MPAGHGGSINHPTAVVFAILSAPIFAASASALGTASYSSELISPRSLGQGATGVAGVHDDPACVYANPAAMTALKGTQFSGGLTYVNASPRFASGVNSSGGLGASYTQSSFDQVSGARATSVVVPDFAATTQFLDGRISAGIAAIAPYGLETHFDGDSPLRYQATDARLRVIDLTPSVAYKLNDMFSLGLGLDYFRALEGALEKKLNTKAMNYALVLRATGNSTLAAGAAVGPDANYRLNGTGDGWGYHLGATFRPSEHHQVGVAYHSSARIGLNGNTQITGLTGTATNVFGGSDFAADARAPLYMPQNIQVGYAWLPDSRTQIEADAAWYDFYSGRQLGVVFSGLTANQSALLNDTGSNPLRFDPRRTMNFSFGIDRRFSDAFAGRLGAYYHAAALPENAFDAAFVDLPRYALTVGGGWRVSSAATMDFAYNAIFFHGRSVDAPDANTLGSGYNGRFNSFANIIALSLTYRTNAHL